MKIIGHGRRSEIMDLGNDKILKLYDKRFPVSQVEAEYEKTQVIYNSNLLNIPEPIEIVNTEGKAGIVFEKIQSISLMDLFQREPWLFFSYTQTVTNLHKSIHGNKISNLPTQMESFSKLITDSIFIETTTKDRLLEILNRKHTPVLCHGDFHHGNILKAKDGFYIIDWMDAFSGCYLLDVALTAVNAMVSDTPTHIPRIYSYIYELLKRIIKLDQRYIKTYGVEPEDIKDYIFLSSGIHLARSDQSKNSSHKKYFESARKLA